MQTPMLQNFVLKNFRSFKGEARLRMEAIPRMDEELASTHTFEARGERLLHSAVVYGANASGKSNLLMAMRFMRWMTLNSATRLQPAEAIDVSPFRLDATSAQNPSEFEITFVLGEATYRYGFGATRQAIVFEYLFRKVKREVPLFLREHDVIDVKHGFAEGKGLEEKTRDNALFLSVVAQFNGEIAQQILRWMEDFQQISGVDDQQYRMLTMQLMQEEPGCYHMINQVMRYADLGIDQIDLVEADFDTGAPATAGLAGFPLPLGDRGPQPSRLKVITRRQAQGGLSPVVFSLDQESAGTQKLFHLAGPVLRTLRRGGVLVVDEMDARLHPNLVDELVRLFHSPASNPHHAQLIFATHQTHLLSTNAFRRDQIWLVEKNRENASALYSLASYKLSDGSKVRKDASLEKQYIIGRFGAVPDVAFEEMGVFRT